MDYVKKFSWNNGISKFYFSAFWITSNIKRESWGNSPLSILCLNFNLFKFTDLRVYVAYSLNQETFSLGSDSFYFCFSFIPLDSYFN